MMLLTLFSLSSVGCEKKLYRFNSIDTSHCDPATRNDCWSVSEQFVRERVALEMKATLLANELHVCRDKNQ